MFYSTATITIIFEKTIGSIWLYLFPHHPEQARNKLCFVTNPVPTNLFITILSPLSIGPGRPTLKNTNLHEGGPKSHSSSSNGGLFERNHPTGASSCSSDIMSSSGNSCYPKETLNPPPSPMTIRSQCTGELYYTPQSPATSRSYRWVHGS